MKSIRCWIAVMFVVCSIPLLEVDAVQKASNIPVKLQFPPQDAPSVSINAVTQPADVWQIDVNFDLMFSEGSPCDIVFEYRGGAVADWTEANGVTGSLYGLYPGSSYSFTWNAQADIPQAKGELYQIRVTAKCGVYVGAGTLDPSSYKIPSRELREISIVNFDRKILSNCFTITYTYNEYVTDYSLLWTNELLSDVTVWHAIPYTDLIDAVQIVTDSGGTAYSWTDCGDANSASGLREEPDNEHIINRLYYLKAN